MYRKNAVPLPIVRVAPGRSTRSKPFPDRDTHARVRPIVHEIPSRAHVEIAYPVVLGKVFPSHGQSQPRPGFRVRGHGVIAVVYIVFLGEDGPVCFKVKAGPLFLEGGIRSAKKPSEIGHKGKIKQVIITQTNAGGGPNVFLVSDNHIDLISPKHMSNQKLVLIGLLPRHHLISFGLIHFRLFLQCSEVP